MFTITYEDSETGQKVKATYEETRSDRFGILDAILPALTGGKYDVV